MASKAEDKIRVQARFSRDTQLGDKWEDWAENFENESVAVRKGLEHGVFPSDDDSDKADGMVYRMFGGLFLTILVLVIGGSIVAFDPVVAAGLSGLSLCAVFVGLKLPLERVV